MSNKRNLLNDLAALRELVPDPAAAQHAIDKTRAALTAQQAAQRPIIRASFWKGTLMRPRNVAAAAAAILFLALATLWILSGSSGNIAFAQVQEQVAKTKSVQYTETSSYKLPGGKVLPGTQNHVMILGDHLKRSEMGVPPGEDDSSLGPWGPSVEIWDLHRKKRAGLYPEIKGYLAMDWHGTFAEAYIDPEAEKHAAEDAKAWDASPESARPSADKSTEKSEGQITGKTVVAPTGDGQKEDLPPNTFEFRGRLEPNGEVKAPATAELRSNAATGGSSKPDQGEHRDSERPATGNWTASNPAGLAALKPFPQLDIYELVRHVPTDGAKKLPEKTLDGQRVIGFQTEQRQKRAGVTTAWQHTWWVNPATCLPVQLEIEQKSPVGMQSGESKSVISKIVFDAPLEPEKFSIEMPPGYFDIDAELKKVAPELEAAAMKPNRMNSLSFVLTENATTKDGRRGPKIVKHVTMLDNRYVRGDVTIEPTAGAAVEFPVKIEPHVEIQDMKQKRMLVLLPDQKTFLDPTKSKFTGDYLQWAQGDDHPPADKQSLHGVFRFPDEKYKRLPFKRIDGKLLYREVAEETKKRGDATITFKRTAWLDPFGSQDALVEGSIRSTDPNVPDIDWEANHFVDGDPVDRALFGLDAPPGFRADERD